MLRCFWVAAGDHISPPGHPPCGRCKPLTQRFQEVGLDPSGAFLRAVAGIQVLDSGFPDDNFSASGNRDLAPTRLIVKVEGQLGIGLQRWRSMSSFSEIADRTWSSPDHLKRGLTWRVLVRVLES
jgi:hypothetical protein